MTEIPDTKLQSAAVRLIKWDKRRSLTTKILGLDVSVARKPDYAEESLAWAVGDFRAIPSIIVASRVGSANKNFCGTISDALGAERLSAEDAEVVPSRLLATGHPSDPLVEFQNGLILRSVDAAHYVLDHSVDAAPGL